MRRDEPMEPLRQALDAEAERRMADAYRQKPDDAEPELIDPAAWEPRKSATRGHRHSQRSAGR